MSETLKTIDDKELLASYDSTQVKLMQELCIIVNENDEGTCLPAQIDFNARDVEICFIYNPRCDSI